MTNKREPPFDNICQEDNRQAQINLIDAIFSLMSPNLKAHRGFISENRGCKAHCDVCSLKVEPIFSISEHLKSKSHEDNTIMFLKNKMPLELYKIFDFVSFFGNDLCCNLCETNIELCSTNLHETIVNIVAHNASKTHLSKTKCKMFNQSDEASRIIEMFAAVDPLINDSKHLIDCKMKLDFKCKLCNQEILYNEDEQILLGNFITHFSSLPHKRRLEISSVIGLYNESNLIGKEKHNINIWNESIYCFSCNFYIASDYQALILHINQSFSGLPEKKLSQNTTLGASNENDLGSQNDKVIESPTFLTENSIHSSQKSFSFPSQAPVQTLRGLLNLLPEEYKNPKCIIENEQKEVYCLVCKCVIPSTSRNIYEHITGNNHIKNEKTTNKNCDFNEIKHSFLLETENIKKESKSEIQPLIDHSQSALTDYEIVDTIFELLPLSLQDNIQFIKPSLENKVITCVICDVNISAHVKCLQEHLEGQTHGRSLNEFFNNHHVVSNLSKNLMGEAQDINQNKKYLGEKYNVFISMPNGTILKNVNQEDLPLRSTGVKHKIQNNNTPVEKEISDFAGTKQSLMTENAGIKSEIKWLPNNNEVPAPSLNSLVEHLFKMLPLYLQNDKPYIRPSIGNNVLCLMCNVNISAHYKCLQEHLEGALHREIVMSNPSVLNRKDSACVPKTLVEDNQLEHLVETCEEIRQCVKYLGKEGGDYVCKPCGAILKNHNEVHLLRDNILQHFNGKKHKYVLSVIFQATYGKKGFMQSDLPNSGDSGTETNLATQLALGYNGANNNIVKNLFGFLPSYLQRNKQLIISTLDGNIISCLICNVNISAHVACLQEHLEGVLHKKSIYHSSIKFNEEWKIQEESDKHYLLKVLIEKNKEIKKCGKYIGKLDNDYLCKACGTVLKNSQEENVLRDTFLNHFNGKKHKKIIDQIVDRTMNGLLNMEPLIRDNYNVLKRQENGFYCTLCSCVIPGSDEILNLKTNFHLHFRKSGHIREKVKLNQTVGTNRLDLISGLFKMLPPHLQSDIEYIRHSNSKGFLYCVLCNYVFDQSCLEYHLLWQMHMEIKQLKMRLNNVSDETFFRMRDQLFHNRKS